MNRFIPAILIFAAVAFGTISLVLLAELLRSTRRRRTLTERLQELEADLAEAAPTTAPGILRSEAPLPRSLEAAFARVPRLRDLALTLEQAQMGWSVQTFLLLTLGGGLGGVLMALAMSGNFLVVLTFGALGASLPNLHLRRVRKKRFSAFEEQLPEAIDLMGRALRAGHPFSAGIKMVADEIPDPLGIEFRRVYEQHRFGLSLPDGLLSLSDRITLVDLRIFVTAVLIQRDVGGNLAEIMDKIAYTTRERFKIRRQIRVHTAQGRMTGYLLAALPVLTTLAFLMINRDYILTMVRDPLGHLIIGVILVLQVIGFFWIRKVVDIEY
jgi:tight adherence protein B